MTDPRTSLRIAEQRRAEFERRAVEHRYARSGRARRTWHTVPLRRRTAVTPPALTCCPA